MAALRDAGRIRPAAELRDEAVKLEQSLTVHKLRLPTYLSYPQVDDAQQMPTPTVFLLARSFYGVPFVLAYPRTGMIVEDP